ncbi:NAD(P)/FAD-dependent oxidoreductase, partial [Acinetobacter soli]
SLSDQSTVGNICGNINVDGLFARMMYISLYRFHQVALHWVFKTSLMIIKDLLSKGSSPQLKLH